MHDRHIRPIVPKATGPANVGPQVAKCRHGLEAAESIPCHTITCSDVGILIEAVIVIMKRWFILVYNAKRLIVSVIAHPHGFASNAIVFIDP